MLTFTFLINTFPIFEYFFEAFSDEFHWRIKSQNKTGSGKADKKGLFKPLISKLIKAGGGNASDLSCAGSKVGDGAKNIKNLTDEIK